MESQHETDDHQMSKCDNCVVSLKKNHRMSQANMAASKWKVGTKVTHSISANTQGIDGQKSKVGGNDENSFAFKEERVDRQPHCLNEDLIDMHMDMQLLSSL